MIWQLLTIIYVLSALLLAIYTSGQLMLLVRYRWHKQTTPSPPLPSSLPDVTIQLPIYNEQHVVKRLLDAVTQLDYPHDKLHIQLLDDSTDETTYLLTTHVNQLCEQGWQIELLHRTARTGFKAGALADGLKQTESEFIAVFDADFVPAPDFLQRTIPYLVAYPQLGMVQTRWGHLNNSDNWLTRAQMLSVDAHFVVEQTARNQSGWFISFNGSGGIWRRSCIEDAGGWSADTLTEDLDLSYRAQLKGWHALYLPDVVVPAELPPQFAAYKQQQARWAMGSVQNLRKLIGQILREKLKLGQRLMAIHHLCQYLPHPLMLILLLVTPPLIVNSNLEQINLAPLGFVGLIPPALYAVSQYHLYSNWGSRLLAFPFLMLIGTGITWNSTYAIWQALSGKKLVFQRTPKFAQNWESSRYAVSASIHWVELLLAIYAAWGVSLALKYQPELSPYLMIYALSFSTVVLWQLYEAWQLQRNQLGIASAPES